MFFVVCPRKLSKPSGMAGFRLQFSTWKFQVETRVSTFETETRKGSNVFFCLDTGSVRLARPVRHFPERLLPPKANSPACLYSLNFKELFDDGSSHLTNSQFNSNIEKSYIVPNLCLNQRAFVQSSSLKFSSSSEWTVFRSNALKKPSTPKAYLSKHFLIATISRKQSLKIPKLRLPLDDLLYHTGCMKN